MQHYVVNMTIFLFFILNSHSPVYLIMAGCVQIDRMSTFLLLALIQMGEYSKGELSRHETKPIRLKYTTLLDEVDVDRTRHELRARSSLGEKAIDNRSSEITTNQRKGRGITDKMKNMWKKMRGKKQEWDLSREEASEMYQTYYQCVTKRYEEAKQLETGKMKPVHAIMALQGERVTLRCTVW